MPHQCKKRAWAGSLARPRPPVNSLAAVFPSAVSQREVQLPDSFVGGADGRRLMAAEIVWRRSHVLARVLQRGNGACDAWVHGAFVLRKQGDSCAQDHSQNDSRNEFHLRFSPWRVNNRPKKSVAHARCITLGRFAGGAPVVRFLRIASAHATSYPWSRPTVMSPNARASNPCPWCRHTARSCGRRPSAPALDTKRVV